jgi:O-antigen ligase
MIAVAVLWLIFIVWILASRQVVAFAKSKMSNRAIVATVLVLLCSIVISMLALGRFDTQGIGSLIVLFIQPIGTFFIAKFIFEKNPQSKNKIIWMLLGLVALSGLLAIIQYATRWTLPPAYWGNSAEPKRAVAFFGHPNFYALFAAPLLAFLLPFVLQLSSRSSKVIKVSLWLIGALGLFVSLSRAGWLGLLAAFIVFVIFSANKKIVLSSIGGFVIVVLVVLSVPNFRYRVLLPFKGEKSSVSRFSLWNTGKKAISEHVVLGQGLTGFSRNWDRLNTDPNIDRHNYPHNVFLNFWTETGLFGLLSFIVLVIYGLVKGWRQRMNIFTLGLLLFLVAFLVQGQFDNPYFKNDLAMLFWLIYALAI